jgi:hypothetical protein
VSATSFDRLMRASATIQLVFACERGESPSAIARDDHLARTLCRAA